MAPSGGKVVYQLCLVSLTGTLVAMSEIAQLYTSGNYSHRVAAEVRSHAARQGLMQKDLAKALGFVPSQITKRMRGQVAFTVDELATLATVFGIEVADLMPRRLDDAEASRQPKVLPRLDLNQQPCGYKELQIRAIGAHASSSRLHLVPDQMGRKADDQTATRPDSHRPFVPVMVRALTVSA